MDRKELEAQILEMVATSYKKDAGDLSMETSFTDRLST